MDPRPATAAPFAGLLVIGIGNPLREDDRVGLVVVERLMAHFGPDFPGRVVYEPDIVLAEEIAAVSTLLIVDALATASDAPWRLTPLTPAATIFPAGGLSSHLFDWGMVLAMARDLFGHAPHAWLCGVRAHSFGLAEELSVPCRVDAEETVVLLRGWLDEWREGGGGAAAQRLAAESLSASTRIS